MKKKAIFIVVAIVVSTMVNAKSINSQNISKNNLALDKKADKICAEKYKGKYKVPGALIFCSDKIIKKWSDQGLYEGTEEYNVKTYKPMASEKLFSLLPNLLKLQSTARQSDAVDSSDYVEGEMYRVNYTRQIIFIINELLSRHYKPHWTKSKTSQNVQSYWHSVVVYNTIQNGG